MKTILNWIQKNFKNLLARFWFKKDIPVEKIEEGLPKEIDLKKMLNTFYLNPQIIKSMPYEMLYNDIFDEIGQMITSLENQWEQNEIDYAFGYISMDRYCENRIDIQEKFKESKRRYLQAMNLA